MKKSGLIILVLLISIMGVLFMKDLRTVKGRFQGYGECGECHNTWNWKNGHSIPYDDGLETNATQRINDGPVFAVKLQSGMFPICEECFWKVSKERLIYHINNLVNDWNREGQSKNLDVVRKTAIENALKERGFIEATQSPKTE
jgi:hypothetical protein